MVDCSQRAVVIGTHPEALTGLGPVPHGPKHLLATEHQLDRLSHHPGRHDAENLWACDHALGTEAAAEEGTADVDFVRGDAEKSREASLRHGETLAGGIDGQRVAVP